MHHSFSSFANLIQQDIILIPELDTRTWKDLWEEYTEEAKKFNSQKRIELFGREDIDIILPTFSSKDNLDNHQKKIIGEFIRRNHSRMAHEIALYGFSTENEKILGVFINDSHIGDIIGLVARSHGMEMRSLYDYVELKYKNISTSPLGIHIWYIMSILRISDFFQIDKNRIRLEAVKLNSITSPRSILERNKHESVIYVEEKDSDPETLFIYSEPKNNVIYWELRDLLDDIQLELDKSWAVLGEKHGRNNLKPQIKYRRIRSNIQDRDYIERVLDYVPERILFNADPDLPYLLVGPLYGDDVTYGVRELLQNAVDACHALAFLSKEKFEPQINISIKQFGEDEYIFEIIDNGIGMNANEVKNYFLKAGATNRRSKEWDQFFIKKDLTSNIIKSGKFGVGILSAFLIGDVISVRTRKINSDYGINFEATLTSKNIEVYKDRQAPLGTTIRIVIKKEAVNKFLKNKNQLVSWDKWYIFSKPKVTYFSVLQLDEKLGYEKFDPSFTDSSNEWKEFYPDGYEKVRWSYKSFIPLELKEYKYLLTCNGLLIPKPPIFGSSYISPPHIQIFDLEGNLPINLGRNSLDTKYLPFEDDLIESIFFDIIEKMLSVNINNPLKNNIINHFVDEKMVEFKNINDKSRLYNGFIYSKAGFLINNSYLLDHFIGDYIIKLNYYFTDNNFLLNLDIKDHWIVINPISKDYKIKGNLYDSKIIKHLIQALYREDNFSNNNPDLILNFEKYDFLKNGLFFQYKKKNSKCDIYFGHILKDQFENIISIETFNDVLFLKSEGHVKDFGYFLKSLFPSKEDSILPYDIKQRIEKIKELKKQYFIKNNKTRNIKNDL